MRISKKQQKLIPFYSALLLCVVIASYPFSTRAFQKKLEPLVVGKLNILLLLCLNVILLHKQPLLFSLVCVFIVEVYMVAMKAKKENFRTYFGLQKLPCVY